MKYLYFKSDKGNFGDDLNPWLWPKIFEGKITDEDHTYFLGIGSILHSGNHKLLSIENNKKIVFGTGVRPSSNYESLNINNNWDIMFLRGPYSSWALGNVHPYISDAAYALRYLNTFEELKNTKKKYEVSIMPYFHSMDYFKWDEIAKKLGYNLISPYSEKGVEHTLKEIAASKYIISEAMHGAILADVLRVPWHRFILTTPYTEGERVSDFKWNDWLNSINIHKNQITFIPFYQKTKLHGHLKKLTGNIVSANFLLKNKVEDDILTSLSQVSNYVLSSDLTIDTIDEKIEVKIKKLIS